MRRVELAAFTAALLFALPANGHDLQHELSAEEALTVSLRFGDGTPFSYEAFEVYREGEEIAFQTGRTDALGRIVLLPDRPGSWRIKVYSEDGHGVDLVVPLDERGHAAGTERSLYERYARVITGVAVIFGVFGLVSLLRRRRAP